MKKPTRRDALLATAAIGAVAATRAKAQATLALENTPMSDVIQALASGRVTATTPAAVSLDATTGRMASSMAASMHATRVRAVGSIITNTSS